MIGGIVGLAAGAVATLGAQAALSGATGGKAPATRAEIEQIVHDYILEHPEILPQAMEKLQQKRMGAAIDDKRSAIETPYRGAWEGAKNGDVTMVEFFDYACGYCRASLPDLAKLVQEDKGLKIVYRELPILSDESNAAARVSLLAAEQDKYMLYHKALYAAGRVTRDTILASAQKAGIDRKAAEKAIGDANYTGEIENNIKLAQTIGASGTPTFVIGNKVLAGAVGYDALKAAIAEARKK